MSEQDSDDGRKSPDEDSERADHDAILARRKWLIASALAGVALATEGCDRVKSVLGIDQPPPPEQVTADPMPCLSQVPETPPQPCLSPMIAPQPCLAPPIPRACLSIAPQRLDPPRPPPRRRPR
ncbi:MAG: hypothetical protein Q8Q09_22475 [Deltaproteobacteria bacterium]|nr:hypothetical protein [Deltaproteobacteria bacterium]